jgi:short chain dehydrogenase
LNLVGVQQTKVRLVGIYAANYSIGDNSSFDGVSAFDKTHNGRALPFAIVHQTPELCLDTPDTAIIMEATMKLFSLSGKTAIVTGGTRGIGQAMAIAMAEAGADIILIQVLSHTFNILDFSLLIQALPER